MSETGKLASERMEASKKIHETTSKIKNEKKVSKASIKSEKNKKNTSIKKSSGEDKK